jgi:hypothetical protein
MLPSPASAPVGRLVSGPVKITKGVHAIHTAVGPMSVTVLVPQQGRLAL